MKNKEKTKSKIVDTVFVADDSQKAADRAIDDALAGKNKDARFNGMLSVKSFLHGNTTMDSFSDTYNKIHDAALQAKAFKAVMDNDGSTQQPDSYREINSVKQGNIIINKTESVNPNSLKTKKELLEKLAQYLEKKFIPQLNYFLNRYENQVATLGRAGLFLEFHEKFSNQCKQVTINQIVTLKRKITTYDLPYIYAAIKYYIRMIDKYGN